MQGKRVAVKVLLVLVAAVAMGFTAPSWTGAQIILLEESVGRESEQTMSPAEGVIVIPTDEPATGEVERGFERPMHVPDTQMDGDMGRLPLRTPDQSDVEQARESDERSAMSF
jgi:hypothetical protein